MVLLYFVFHEEKTCDGDGYLWKGQAKKSCRSDPIKAIARDQDSDQLYTILRTSWKDVTYMLFTIAPSVQSKITATSFHVHIHTLTFLSKEIETVIKRDDEAVS